MKANPLRSSAGFTYLMALMIVLIMGIMVAAVGQSWKMVRDRELEEEFLFRGQQYKDAMTRWYTRRPGESPAMPLNDLKDLLKDPNVLTNKRYLRELYPDPLTGKEWSTIRGGTTGGIIGVFSSYSSSERKPIKQANFPTGLEDFEGKTSFRDWKFVYQPQTATTQPTPAAVAATRSGATASTPSTPATGPATAAAPSTAR